MTEEKRVEFKRDMKKDYTILIPNMAVIHLELIKNAFIFYGYNMVLLKNSGRAVVDEGLKYVHNDTCYPALLCIGQMIDALKSGEYDVNKTALMITQTGGGCRASNYIHLLRKALQKAGYAQVPVISLNLSGLEKNEGFRLSIPMLRKALAALAYGDLLMLLDNQVKPYEVNQGESAALVQKWIGQLTENFGKRAGYSYGQMKRTFAEIADSFADIKVQKTKKTKVGIVGEIYVKYSALANNDLEAFLFEQGCEVMVPGLVSFMMFKTDNRLEDIKLYGGSLVKKKVVTVLMNYLIKIENALYEAVKIHDCFLAPSKYEDTKKSVDGIIGYGNKMGEGWLLTAEMVELTENGYQNIVCAQPFGCLPNHIVGKGMIQKIRKLYPEANIVPIDYDPGATRVNQENRIKLMLAVARDEELPEKYTKPSEERIPLPIS